VTVGHHALHDRYFDALVRSDPAAATDVVLDLLESGASLSEIVEDVIAPAQVLVGELWERGEWSVAQEHAATAVTEAAVSAVWVMTARRQLTDGPHIALACAEGEWHAVPARMAAALAAEAGAHVTVLGPSMPSDHLRRRLDARDIDLLAVSCTVPVNLLGAARCVAAARAVGVPVLVGGRAFAGRPQRAEAIGADGLLAAPQELVDPPPAVRDHVRLAEESLRLDAVSDATIDQVFARVVAADPRIAGLPPAHQDRTREDLRWIVRFTGAAVLTGDPTVLDEFFASLLRILHGRVPEELVLSGADIVADELEPLAPSGASMLRHAVHHVRRTD
jgi:MerR family transcriptional regulator, light-induced transcriptional regulator